MRGLERKQASFEEEGDFLMVGKKQNQEIQGRYQRWVEDNKKQPEASRYLGIGRMVWGKGPERLQGKFCP